jgi:2-C-methyl-D-erythritol 4-phosphate cytidylyltransferase
MNIALILASGTGSRIKSRVPKQYIKVKGKPVLVYTMEAFQNNPLVDKIYIVANKDYIKDIEAYAVEYGIEKFVKVIQGGQTRHESSFLGLSGLKRDGARQDDIVLIHDAARAFISQDIITNNIKACEQFDAVNTAIDVTDTIFVSTNKDVIGKTLDRSTLMASQTPQTFKFDLIYESHKKNQDKVVTDDAQIARMNNHPIHIVQGNENNFKITTKQDLDLFKLMVCKREKECK